MTFKLIWTTYDRHIIFLQKKICKQVDLDEEKAKRILLWQLIKGQNVFVIRNILLYTRNYFCTKLFCPHHIYICVCFESRYTVIFGLKVCIKCVHSYVIHWKCAQRKKVNLNKHILKWNYLSIYLNIYLPIYLSIYLPIYLFMPHYT